MYHPRCSNFPWPTRAVTPPGPFAELKARLPPSYHEADSIYRHFILEKEISKAFVHFGELTFQLLILLRYATAQRDSEAMALGLGLTLLTLIDNHSAEKESYLEFFMEELPGL